MSASKPIKTIDQVCRWDQIGEFGPMVMSLEEALDYVAKDPVGIFWD